MKQDAVEADELCISVYFQEAQPMAVDRRVALQRPDTCLRRWRPERTQPGSAVAEGALRLYAWQRRLVYTDGYAAYATFFSAWQHRVF